MAKCAHTSYKGPRHTRVLDFPQWNPDRFLAVRVTKPAAYTIYRKFGTVINQW